MSEASEQTPGCVVHSCSESAEKGRLTKAEGCLGCSRQEIKQKQRHHLGGNPGTGGQVGVQRIGHREWGWGKLRGVLW